MRREDQYIESDNSYHEPSRDNSSSMVTLVVIITILMVVLTLVIAFIYFAKDKKDKEVLESSDPSAAFIAVATQTPTPMADLLSFQNPLLYPPVAVNINTVYDEIAPAPPVGLTQNIIEGGRIVSEYQRPNPINFGDPLCYSHVAGILTYRGDNFRSCASYGITNVSIGTITELWEYEDLGTRLSSTMTFEWEGVRLTGQPLVVRWDDNIRESMNLYADKASKSGLTEVIVASLDGNIYFFDLDDGTMTRDPISVGASIKGTPAIDPRGYPIIYVGQSDDNADDGNFGFYIYSLIDGSRLWYYSGEDDGAYRVNWTAFDSSPLIDANTDTLIWPAENGIIYTFTLHTTYSIGGDSISIMPEVVGFKYIFADSLGARMGVESSIAIYSNYGYFVDNNSDLICLDLNTMRMVWKVDLGDDSDLSPVVAEENGCPYVYVGTEVDSQSGEVGEYQGAAYTYKVDGLTGDIMWQNSIPCYTYNGETSDTDQSGGCFGNPIIGKKSISNLVIFSYSMTNGLMSGNQLVAYDRNLGTSVWTYNMNIYTYSSPIDIYDVQGNCYILICDTYGQIHLINGQTGERINYIRATVHMGTNSETSDGVAFEGSPVVFGNKMIIGTTNGSIICFEIA